MTSFRAAKFLNQELFNILLRRLFRKRIGERHHHQVIDAIFIEQFNFFVDGIDELDTGLAAYDHFPRVGVEGDDHRFPANTGSFAFQLLQNGFVAGMHPIERAYRNNSLFKGRNGFC